MTWQNLPCAPTLPALFAACPHGWAEIEFTYHAGNPTAAPPQDADCAIGFGRVWGVDRDDLRGGPSRPTVLHHDVLLDLREPPLGMPHRDCTLLARVVHRAGPCNTCGRQRGPDETEWFCYSGDWTVDTDECTGAFPFECVLETCWGVDGKPVVFVGVSPAYGLAAAPGREEATTAIESTAPVSMRGLLLKAALLREKRAYPNVETFAARLLVEVFGLDADDGRLDLDDDDTDVLADLVADLDNATVEFARTWNED